MDYCNGQAFVGWVKDDAIVVATRAGIAIPVDPKYRKGSAKFRLGSNELTIEFIPPFWEQELPKLRIYFPWTRTYPDPNDDDNRGKIVEVNNLADTVELAKTFQREFPNLPPAVMHFTGIPYPE